MTNLYQAVDSNKWKSNFVVFGFFLFIVGAATLLSYSMGFGLDLVGVSLIIGGISSLIGYYFSDRIVLAMNGARPADRNKDFHFYTVTENLAMAAQLPMPRLYVIEDSSMNAFATGRDPKRAVVCATTGLLEKLTRTELEGVVAHELAHVRNYDIRLMSLVSVMIGFIALLADFALRFSFYGNSSRRSNDKGGNIQAILFIAGIVLALLTPIIAQLIQLAISRRREYLADATAVEITKYPGGLISALKKLGGDKTPLKAANKATAHMYIVNPLNNHHDAIGWFSKMFNTHPPLPERIQSLEKLQGKHR